MFKWKNIKTKLSIAFAVDIKSGNTVKTDGMDADAARTLTVLSKSESIILKEPTIKKSIGKWKKVKKIFLAKKHSKASYLQIAGLRYKN